MAAWLVSVDLFELYFFYLNSAVALLLQACYRGEQARTLEVGDQLEF